MAERWARGQEEIAAARAAAGTAGHFMGMDESEALTVASRELIEEVGERLLELVKMGASDEAASP